MISDETMTSTVRRFVGGNLVPMTCGTTLECVDCGNSWVGVFSAFIDERELPCPRCGYRHIID